MESTPNPPRSLAAVDSIAGLTAPHSSGMDGGSRRAAAASAVLPVPDELTVEILARLPAKSICLCKCVSRAWRALISDPANRRRFAQTLAGLFFQRPYDSRRTWDFVGLSMSSVLPPPPGVDMALSFLPPTCREVELMDSCNGLLLLRCEDTRELPSPPPFYVVCNPATGEWVTLPQPSYVPGLVECSDDGNLLRETRTAALGFDPSISPHFHVFQLVQDFFVQAVEIYSSQTGRWDLSKVRLQGAEMGEMADWREYTYFTGRMTYFKGFLHLCTRSNAVLSVHTSGKTWKISQLRHRQYDGYCPGFSICHSQGCLLFVDSNCESTDVMSIYVLEDLDSEEWTWDFKQTINKPDLFGPRMPQRRWNYCTTVFHPDSDLIFFYDWSQKRLVSYDMKHRDVHVISTPEVPYFEFQEMDHVRRNFLPYVPLYSGALPSSCLNQKCFTIFNTRPKFGSDFFRKSW